MKHRKRKSYGGKDEQEPAKAAGERQQGQRNGGEDGRGDDKCIGTPHAVGQQTEDCLDKARDDGETGTKCGGGPQRETQTGAEDGNERGKKGSVQFDTEATTKDSTQCITTADNR